jgi:hypothetical protein
VVVTDALARLGHEPLVEIRILVDDVDERGVLSVELASESGAPENFVGNFGLTPGVEAGLAVDSVEPLEDHLLEPLVERDVRDGGLQLTVLEDRATHRGGYARCMHHDRRNASPRQRFSEATRVPRRPTSSASETT